MIKRNLFLILILLLASANPAGAIKYKGDLESNESVTFPEQSAKPTSPAATKHKLYFKDDGVVYSLDSSGDENPVDRGGFKNKIINGNFDIWQRGTSFATPSANTYTADRWKITYSGSIGTFTVSRQDFTLGQTDVPGEPEHYIRWDHTAAGSGQGSNILRQFIEDVRTFANQTITLSFWGKADSARTVSTSFTQTFGTGGSPSADVLGASTPHSFTTSWQKFTHTFTLASISGKTLGTNNNSALIMQFLLPLNTIKTIDIARAQLEKGSVATEFERRPEMMRLALAQRYYEVQAVQTVNGDVWINWHTPKRGTPTTSTTTGSLNNTTVDGSRLNHSSSVAATITASAEF